VANTSSIRRLWSEKQKAPELPSAFSKITLLVQSLLCVSSDPLQLRCTLVASFQTLNGVYRNGA